MDTENCKQRNPPKFMENWMGEIKLKNWLEKRFNRKKNIDLAFCTACSKFLTNTLLKNNPIF